MNENHGQFGLPEGYFQKSAGSILNRIAWQEEHKDYPYLLKLKNTGVFTVPENYFSKAERRLELIAYPGLTALPKRNNFKVPENYFQDLELLKESPVSEEEELSGLRQLQALKKEMPYRIPKGYFEENKKQLEQLAAPKQAKIISLVSKRVAFAAAALVLVLLSVWLYSFYGTAVAAEDCGTIACLDKNDLVKSRSLDNLDDDELYELVDPRALEKKLNAPAAQQPPVQTSDETDSSLKGISDEELLDELN